MSFLNNNSAEFLPAKVTKKGRNAIANGNFIVSYFQVGDSEFDYTDPFFNFTGLLNIPSQKVMSPFDIEGGVKYPYKLDTSVDSTTFGAPISNASVEKIRNVMGPAGYVTNYINFDNVNATGTTIQCYSEGGNLSSLTGGTSLNVTNGNGYQECEYITLTLVPFGGTDPNFPVITGQTNSYIYKILQISGNTLTLDRPIPDFSSLSGQYQVVCNDCELEYNPCEPINYSKQLNPWTMNIVWDEKPIGADYPVLDEDLSGYTSNIFVSTKEFLGYNSTGQTFTNYSGGSISKPTSYIDSFLEEISVETNLQRCISILHYSQIGDLNIDPDRFFKYDDYLSYDDGSLTSIVDDEDGNPLTDREYFEIYIPFLLYHRNTGTTTGAKFSMDTSNNYLKSTKNEYHELMFKYLIDEQGYKVGKIFPHNKIIIFDDQEIVAALDYRSNRRFTYGAPRIGLTPSDNNPENSLLSGTTGQTVWVTYMLSVSDTNDDLNSLPCNYYSKIQGNNTPCDVTVKFSGNTFQFMGTSYSNLTDSYVAKRFYILVQRTDTGDTPKSNLWRILDFTTNVGGNGITYINPSNITGITFTINQSDYDSADIFDLEDFLSVDYLGSTLSTDEPQFGDEQSFPGSIRCIRSTDLEVMNFEINLPSTQFLETQNPTYGGAVDKKITEIALLNNNKETLVIAKAATPVTRIGTQVFSVKIDF